MNKDNSTETYYKTFIQGKEKITPARIDILKTLSSFKKPVSIKKIAYSTKGYNTTTIYRTLETLLKIGLVKKINNNPKESLYETTIDRKHHHHITCTSCGLLEDIHICVPHPSQKMIANKGFTFITDHSLEFFGLCKTCKKVS
jgi:Fe2+ or Zn2+ uptake regulation protein